MARLLLLSTFVIGFCLKLSLSTSISCNYYVSSSSWNIISNEYYCVVYIDPSITTKESATITSISGTHQSGKTNSDVSVINVNSKTINYFWHNLETFFKNIRAFHIASCKLKEIHQEDLKPYPKLAELYLIGNLIEVLEDGLFDFNPNLEHINFDNNAIVHIEPKVFDHLSKLRYLFLSLNSCINKDAKNSLSEVKNVIQSAKSQCINSEFSSLNEKLENLEKDSKTLSSQNYAEKFSAFEKTFNASKFANFRPLNYKFEALKNLQVDHLILKQTSDLDVNLGNMSDLVTKVSTEVNDLKSTQIILKEVKGPIDGFESALGDLKTGQSSILGSISEVCTKQTLSQVLSGQQSILNSQNNLKSSLDTIISTMNLVKSDVSTSIKTIDTKADKLESSVNQQSGAVLSSLNNLKTSHEQLKSSQDDIKSSIDDLEASLNSLKSSQTDLKSSINKIKSSQYEMKDLIDQLKVQENENADDKLQVFGDKIEGQLMEIKAQNEKELTNTRHKITVTIDEKIKGIEKRLMKKFEDVLEEKFGKILEMFEKISVNKPVAD